MAAPRRQLDIEVTIRHDDAGSVGKLRVIGEFDRSQVRYFDRIADALSDDLVHVEVDLSQTDIIDSAALGSLVRLRKGLDANCCRLTTVISRPFQITTMKVGGLFEHLCVEIRAQGG